MQPTGLPSFSQKNSNITITSVSDEYSISKGNNSTLEQLDSAFNTSVSSVSSTDFIFKNLIKKSYN